MLAIRPRRKPGRDEKAARDAGVFHDRAPGRAPARAKTAATRRLVAFVRDEDGGPLVEFTILLPIIFLIIFGIVEWGNIYFIQNSLFIAARLAARQARGRRHRQYDRGRRRRRLRKPEPDRGHRLQLHFHLRVQYGLRGRVERYGAKLWDRHDDHLHARRDGRRLQL